MARKKVIGLDAGFPKSKRRRPAPQPAAGSSAEREAEPFSKPKPTRTKLGPRQQMKAAAADQENCSASANALPEVRSKATARQSSKVKVPNAPKLSKCGTRRHCPHPKAEAGMPLDQAAEGTAS